MAKFNQKKPTNVTTNLAGGKAFSVNKKFEIVSILLTSMVQDQYYEKSSDMTKRFIEAVHLDPLFTAKASIYSRNEFGLRSINHVVGAEIPRVVKNSPWVQSFIDRVVFRVDDITEIMSYYLNNYGKPIPNSLKKGLAKAFGKFDSYQLAKYRAEGKAVSLVDVVNLVHPKHNEAIAKLVSGELKSTETWEAKISASGKAKNKEEAKSEAWRELILEKKIGYFALVRNLRNLLESVPDLVKEIADLLVNENMIKKSKLFPFRFLTAYNELKILSSQKARVLNSALTKAVDISCSNLPKLDNTVVVIDYSGSMGYGDNYSSLRNKATVLALAMAKANNSDIVIFGNNATYVNYDLDSPLLDLVSKFARFNEHGNYYVGHGTNFHSIFQALNKKYDRIILFSDMQAWVTSHFASSSPKESFKSYKSRHKADPFVYSIDMSGYGTSQFNDGKVFQIAGYSEKIFDIIKLLEQDKNALIKKIEAIEL